MKTIFISAVVLSALSGGILFSAGTAQAGPYAETKHEFKGDEDGYSKMENQLRIGYETQVNNFKPYVEVGPALESPESGESEYFTVMEVGTKVKLTEDLSAYIKNENKFFSGGDMDWKIEAGTKYKF